MRIIIGGGGTGGHLIPGIALSKELKNQKHTIKYVLREQDIAYNAVQNLDLDELITISLTGISRKLSFQSVHQIWQIFREWHKAFKQIKKFQPDILIITGGYVSNIVALSAFIMRKPLYILEQNSVAGITNRFWAKIAKKIFTTFPITQKLPQNKLIYTGNPLLYHSQLSIVQAKSLLEIPATTQKVIGISGGSQGARFINKIILKILPILIQKNYQIIWSLGIREYEYFMQENLLKDFSQHDCENHLKIYRFIDRMDAFWSASDIVIARSGAGTVSEALFFTTPTIFIPIPHSPDNHQFLNAQFLVDKNRAYILEEPSLTTELLLNQIQIAMDNSQKIKDNFSKIEFSPVQKIINNIEEL